MSSIATTAGNATEHIKDTATRTAAQAKGSFLELGTQVLRLVNGLRVLEMRTADNLLDRVGLQRRESALRPVLWFAAGAVVAGSAVLLLTPATGKQLRSRIAKLLTAGIDEAKSVEHGVEAKLEALAGDAKKTVAAATSNVEARVGVALDEMGKRSHGPQTEKHS